MRPHFAGAHLATPSDPVPPFPDASDDAALALVTEQGFGSRTEYGPRAPQTAEAFLKLLRLARKRGYSLTVQTFAQGMAAMAAPI